jgi:sec-independent protein translocase protein TatA
MGGFSLWHWLIVGIIILLLFGKGRFSDMMGDVAKGLKSFKKGLAEDEHAAQPRIEGDRTVEGRADPLRTADPVRTPDPVERREP